jgi:hypothetical protein
MQAEAPVALEAAPAVVALVEVYNGRMFKKTKNIIALMTVPIIISGLSSFGRIK